jgi:hypothetical protein
VVPRARPQLANSWSRTRSLLLRRLTLGVSLQPKRPREHLSSYGRWNRLLDFLKLQLTLEVKVQQAKLAVREKCATRPNPGVACTLASGASLQARRGFLLSTFRIRMSL